MNVPWIRVNAALADDAEVRAFALALLPAMKPREAIAATCGLLVTLWGELADHQPNGVVSACDDDQLEAWARWWGEPGTFAQAWRDRFTSRGVVKDWEEYNGRALKRLEADAERKRIARGAKPSAKKALPRPADSPQGELDMSSVNGDGDGDGDGQLQADRVVRKPEPTPARAQPEPPADRTIRTEHGEVTFPADAQRLLERFYRTDPARMADAARQLLGALGPGAILERGVAVRAVNPEHLAEACRAVLVEPPRNEALAARFVLLRLRDTYLEVASRIEAEQRQRERAEKDERVQAAQSYVDAIGGLWDRIEAEVDALLPVHLQGKPSPARNLMLETAVLDAFERKRTLEPDAPFAAERPAASESRRAVATSLPAQIPPDLLEEGL